MRASEVVAVVVLVTLLGAGTAFAVSPGGDRGLSPVAFEETLATGMTGVDVQVARTHGYEIPQVELFYAQFRYVVGYYGVGTAVGALTDPTTTTRFGQPLAIFVTDYSDTQPRLTSEGYVTLDNAVARSWTRARDAVYVVDSDALTPGGPAVLPFADRADASAFAARAGGRVVPWSGLDDPGTARPWDAVLERRATTATGWADAAASRSRDLLERPVSLTVGTDAPTLSAAVARAPPNTTVLVPPGRYQVDLTVEKPITIRGTGPGTVLDGGGAGTVLTLAHPRTALAGVRVTGVGDRDVGNLTTGNASGWDARIKLAYGRGDAGVRLVDATAALVADVEIDTPSNGTVLLESDGAVVDGVRVNGTAEWAAGFMGVLPMHSRVLVQDSTVVGGRDGVYTHRADGTVLRNNSLREMRFGIHEMYTSDTFVANNTVRATDVGIIVMTRPRGTVLLANDVRRSGGGIATAGSAAITARNVVTANDIGIVIGTARSSYAHNTVTDNGLGVRDDTLLPTNDVFANDVVANDRPVDTGRGVLLVWARDGRGNYWGGVPGGDPDADGVIDRPFVPTNALDRAAVDGGGPALFATSPAVDLARGLQGTVPGLRPSGVLDPAPLAGPVRPTVLSGLRNQSARDRRLTPQGRGGGGG